LDFTHDTHNRCSGLWFPQNTTHKPCDLNFNTKRQISIFIHSKPYIHFLLVPFIVTIISHIHAKYFTLPFHTIISHFLVLCFANTSFFFLQYLLTFSFWPLSFAIYFTLFVSIHLVSHLKSRQTVSYAYHTPLFTHKML
jgi:hypothetical protein